MGRSGVGAAVLLVPLLMASVGGCTWFETPRHPAYDLITDTPYRSLVIEIDQIAGYGPHSDARSLLLSRAMDRLSKPDGISFAEGDDSDTISGGRSSWTEGQLREVESSFRDTRTSGTTASLYVLYVNGHSSRDTQDSRVLGVLYGPTSIAIFKATVLGETPTSQLFGAREIERAVIVHEFGHAMGLVDCGIPMSKDRLDRSGDHGICHSTNQQSVMYGAVETSDIFAFLSPPPNNFDPDDQADVRAAGGQ